MLGWDLPCPTVSATTTESGRFREWPDGPGPRAQVVEIAALSADGGRHVAQLPRGFKRSDNTITSAYEAAKGTGLAQN